MIVALANGLGALHAANIVHRDVKPANLLIVGDAEATETGSATVQRRGLLAVGERVVVGDLGLAKDQDRTAAGPTIMGGTPHYRAPEQAASRCGDRPAGRRVRGDRGAVEPPHRRCPGGERFARCTARHRSAGVARGVPSRPRTGARGAVRHDARVGSGRARGARRRHRKRSRSASAPRHPERRARTRAWRRSSPRTPRSSSAGKRSSTSWSRGCRPSRTLVIGGPSGSGKSSLLRAGLVPNVAAGALPGSQHWPIVIFTPGADPMKELAYQLDRLTGDARGADGGAVARRPAVHPAVSLGADSRLARHRPVRRAVHARHRRRRSARVPRCVGDAHRVRRREHPSRARTAVRLLFGVRALCRGSRTASATTRSSSARCGATS